MSILAFRTFSAKVFTDCQCVSLREDVFFILSLTTQNADIFIFVIILIYHLCIRCPLMYVRKLMSVFYILMHPLINTTTSNSTSQHL